eukprot:TRINITY_DN2074_c0_g1_i1.p1 TRINITY_DN2074_c0_g1~~TRINITY_DN2074_c0_g1_i1.p1  ORF type:complete len:236 (-),score=29.63 TRINITY_DN2074_c0_g1_i1:13-720(-)
MEATFGPSYFGQSVVLTDELTPIRLVFVVSTILLGLLAVFYCIYRYSQLPMGSKRNDLIVSLFALYLLHVFIHTAHYADNIARPISYFEPEWLYKRYLLSTMEITYFVNWPTMIGGSITVMELIQILHKHHNNSPQYTRAGKKLCFFMMLYILQGTFTVMHYAVEPPSSYQPEVNFTIAGEGVVVIFLTIAIVICYRKFNENSTETEMQRLNEEDLDNRSILFQENTMRRRSRGN